MDFRFTPEQEQLRQDIRRFLDEHVSAELRAEIATSAHTPGPLARCFLRLLGERGWLGIGWPTEYGGQGRTMLEQMIFYDELDLRDIHYGGLTITSLAMTLMKLASEEQKRTYLPRILRGELEICLGYTEPGAGSDLASLITRAERDRDDYVITGQKVFTTGAHYSSHIWLLARTDPGLPRHKGLSVFIFPLDSPGITVRPLYTMGRIRTNEVFLDHVRVPASAMIGAPNSGFHTVAVALDFERIFMGKYARLRRNFSDLVACCRKLSRNGRTLLEDPVVQDRLVGLHIAIERLRLLCFKSAWKVDRGQVPTAEASAQKVLASELEQRLADEGMKILGPCGQLESGSPHAPMEGRLVDAWLLAPMMRFGGGTNEIQRDIIAQRGLGLPRA
ncbi:MAG: Acyl-CoA dehydrogenase FadE26 [Steroidobacteraceae bacterium]|nr:Acyl-CoA dehydrogenase FadE26 [Steroidobacteraceae bacterium]